MGEYYRAVNLNKNEYIDASSLGLSVKLSGILEPPFSSMLIWLLAEGKSKSKKFKCLGAWAGNRIVLAGDEGSAATIWELTHDAAQFTDISVSVFEEYVNEDIFRRIKYWEMGFIDDTGALISDEALRVVLRQQRGEAEPPEYWF